MPNPSGPVHFMTAGVITVGGQAACGEILVYHTDRYTILDRHLHDPETNGCTRCREIVPQPPPLVLPGSEESRGQHSLF